MSMNNHNIKKTHLSVLIILIFIFSGGKSIDLSAVHHYYFEKRFLLVLDDASLNCHLCLRSLDDFLDLVREYDKEQVTTGILISSENSDDKTEKQIKIIKKQLDGFRIGNNIKFPIIFDEEGVFHFKERNGLFLVVFDNESRIIKIYPFPIKQEDYDEIFEIY